MVHLSFRHVPRNEAITMARDYAVHPDLLVHWTGDDFDPRCCRCPKNTCRSARKSTPIRDVPEDIDDKYLGRLRDILTYGLWMTSQRKTDVQDIDKKGDVPDVARICFTELRLSLARKHARRYGMLGIGVKRPFLFDRGGRPVVYCGTEGDQQRDVFLQASCRHLPKDFLHFFKRIHSGSEEFEYYDESEWRIIFTHELAQNGHVIDPSSNPSPEVRDYWNRLSDGQREKLRFLLPLDGWLSCIVYPSVSVKSKALDCQEVRDAIARLKADPGCRANQVEAGNWPVEIDLDLCRNL